MIIFSKMVDFELSIWEVFLAHPMVLTPGGSLAMGQTSESTPTLSLGPHMGNGGINWGSEVGIWGILVINGASFEYRPLEIREKAPLGYTGFSPDVD